MDINIMLSTFKKSAAKVDSVPYFTIYILL